MNAKQLVAHFERMTDAPDAVPRLRQLVLELAVRGKLVPQDQRDEPAEKLLNRIAEAKACSGRIVRAKAFDQNYLVKLRGCSS